MVGPSVDLLAILRPARVSVTVAGQRFPLEATTAAQWLGAIAMDMDSLHGVVPGLVCDQDLESMTELMFSRTDIDSRWTNAARVALGRAAGRDWWWALNLSRKAIMTWMYTNGILLRQNINSQKLSYPDWLDACYTLYWQNAEEADRMKLDMELAMRPAGVAIRRTRAQVRQEAAAFAAD